MLCPLINIKFKASVIALQMVSLKIRVILSKLTNLIPYYKTVCQGNILVHS